MFSTRTSQVVPHLSTNRACPCLTSQIRRDAVLSRKYGRTWNDLTRRATCSKKQRDSDGERNLWLGPTTIHRLPPAAWQLRHILMQSVCPWRPCDDRQAALAMPHASQTATKSTKFLVEIGGRVLRHRLQSDCDIVNWQTTKYTPSAACDDHRAKLAKLSRCQTQRYL